MNRKMLLRRFDLPPGTCALCVSMKKQHLLMLNHGGGPWESGHAQMNLQPLPRTSLYGPPIGLFSLVENSYGTHKSALLSLDSGSYRT